MTTQDFWNKVKAPEYKMTKPRLAFAEVLVANQNIMLPVESLYLKTKAIFPKTNLSTIYRNLETLEQLNMIYKVNTAGGITLYKLKCANSEHHHHIICTECGKVLDIHYCPFDAFSKLAAQEDFAITEHRLELYGICGDCKRRQLEKS